VFPPALFTIAQVLFALGMIEIECGNANKGKALHRGIDLGKGSKWL
jgi:hypothetical protein